jgi:fumarate reductase subunit C
MYHPPMKHSIINRYLMREITGVFVLGLTIFTLVLLLVLTGMKILMG